MSSSEEDQSSMEEDSDQEYESSNAENPEESFKGEYSMEELLNMREKLGSKIFDQKIATHIKKKEIESKTSDKHGKQKDFVRANKNRPHEMSSKRPVRLRASNPAASKSRDPRFDEICGSKFDKDTFEARYSFLTDVRARDRKILQKKLKKAKIPEQREKFKYLIQRFDNQEREKIRHYEEKEVIQKWRKEEKIKVAQGKKPYFLKDSLKKKLIKEHRQQKKLDKKGNGKRDLKQDPQSSSQ